MGRAPCCDKANVKRGPWSPEEDAKLKAYIEEHGTGGNWIALPHKIGLKRCGKSCRLRWLNYLRPNIKHGDFSEEEDIIICSFYISIGSRWSTIAAQLPGRTDNDIKNYWNTRLKKKLVGKHQEEAKFLNHDSHSLSQFLSASAFERIQLHMQLQGLHSPFFFYNHASTWPKHHPLADISLLGQHTNAVIAAPVQQTLDASSSSSSSSMSTTMQEELENSVLGFSSSSWTNAFSVEQQNSSLDSKLQADLHKFLYRENSSFGGEEHHQVNDGEEKMNWCNGYGFEEKPDALFPEVMLGFDL